MAQKAGHIDLAELERALGYCFGGATIFAESLTHPSAGQGRSRSPTPYERLEFLGDRVLGLVVAEMLLARFPAEKEGALAQRHAGLVRRESLARVARSIGLGRYLRLSRGEEDAGGRANPAILADACEAVIGALFAHGGFEVARRFVRRLWEPLMDEAAIPPKDAKTALQEWAQGQGRPLPVYEILAAEGPAHELVFSVQVSVEGEEPVTGSGPSKRLAEQAAAERLLGRVS